jgi:hypothetical protein
MKYTGVWGQQPRLSIEIDETDSDEIADIHARMGNQTDEKIRDEVVLYLISEARKYRYAKDNPPPKPELVWNADDFSRSG